MVISAQELATSRLKRAVDIFRKDLEALPDDAFTKSFGPKTRTVADIVFEVNMVNDHVGKSLRKQEVEAWPDDEGWIKAPADFCDKKTVIAAFDEVSTKQIETAESFSEEQMLEVVKSERGESAVYERFMFMALHMWYHSGQLNYVQTLVGDDGWHW